MRREERDAIPGCWASCRCSCVAADLLGEEGKGGTWVIGKRNKDGKGNFWSKGKKEGE